VPQVVQPQLLRQRIGSAVRVQVGDGLVRPSNGTQARSLRIDHPNVWSVMSYGGDDLDLGAFGVRVLKKLHALLLSTIGAVARPLP
jgi:hypothetical protein